MLAEAWSDLRYRLRRVFRRRAVDAELDAELRFHLEREAEKHVAAGHTPEEARRLAVVALGGLARTKDDTGDAHGTAMVEQLMQDVRYALRGLRARPMFTAVVVATFGLGLGVNAAMFGIIDRAMFRPPPLLRDPSTVHRVFLTWSSPDGKRLPQRKLEYTRYADLTRWTRATSELAAFAYLQMPVGDGENTREREVATVTASFFDFFGAKPVLGRFFTSAEDSPPAGDLVVVLAHAFWQAELAGRREILGSQIKIGRSLYRVIGIAPRGFTGIVHRQQLPVAFIPVTAYASIQNAAFYKDYGWSWLDVIVRRNPGVTVAQADADLSNAFLRSWDAARALEPTLPAPELVRPVASAGPVLLSRGPAADDNAKMSLWVGGVATIVLAIACANVANLLLARSLRRRRELAVRRALGGSRGRLVRQLLTETMTLAVFGGLAGLVGAQLASGALRRVFASAAGEVNLLTDPRTIAFATTLTLATALLAGLLPALHSGRDDLSESLRGGMRDGGYRGERARRTLLVFQTALSVVLLVGAGLFVRSLHAVRTQRIGYDVDQIVLASVAMRGVQLDADAAARLADRLVAEAREIPGVEHASLTVSVPFWSSGGRRLFVPGVDSVQRLGRFTLHSGSTSYFATTGTRIVRGRGFSHDDRAGAPRVAVVSDAMARVLWNTESPIGKCFRIGSDTTPCTTVVGVAENIRTNSITNDAEFAYYLPFDQYRADYGPRVPFVYVRVKGDASEFAEKVRSRLQPIMPGAAYVTTNPLRDRVDPTMQTWTSGATMFSTFGGLALVLASIGLYAVVAFGVAQRMNEIGVRIALGALPRDVVGLVVGEGVRVTLIGVALGAVVSATASKWVEPLLYKVSPRDPMVFVAVTLLLLAIGVLASLVPAARAARVDPNLALRAE